MMAAADAPKIESGEKVALVLGAGGARVQLALDPPELVIRIPRDACQFYEFWRARELIAIGRAEADAALNSAGY